MGLQEIYPPKVHQFAYVTDGACTEEEILSMEVIIMKVNALHLVKIKFNTHVLNPEVTVGHFLCQSWKVRGLAAKHSLIGLQF